MQGCLRNMYVVWVFFFQFKNNSTSNWKLSRHSNGFMCMYKRFFFLLLLLFVGRKMTIVITIIPNEFRAELIIDNRSFYQFGKWSKKNVHNVLWNVGERKKEEISRGGRVTINSAKKDGHIQLFLSLLFVAWSVFVFFFSCSTKATATKNRSLICVAWVSIIRKTVFYF